MSSELHTGGSGCSRGRGCEHGGFNDKDDRAGSEDDRRKEVDEAGKVEALRKVLEKDFGTESQTVANSLYRNLKITAETIEPCSEFFQRLSDEELMTAGIAEVYLKRLRNLTPVVAAKAEPETASWSWKSPFRGLARVAEVSARCVSMTCKVGCNLAVGCYNLSLSVFGLQQTAVLEKVINDAYPQRPAPKFVTFRHFALCRLLYTASYENDNVCREKILDPLKSRLIRHCIVPGKNECSVLYAVLDDVNVVAVRGTYDLKDIMADLKIVPVLEKHGAKLHSGFYENAIGIANSAEFQEYLEKKFDKGKPLLLLGHSLGGAVVEVLARSVAGKFFSKYNQFVCVTFGQPSAYFASPPPPLPSKTLYYRVWRLHDIVCFSTHHIGMKFPSDVEYIRDRTGECYRPDTLDKLAKHRAAAMASAAHKSLTGTKEMSPKSLEKAAEWTKESKIANASFASLVTALGVQDHRAYNSRQNYDEDASTTRFWASDFFPPGKLN